MCQPWLQWYAYSCGDESSIRGSVVVITGASSGIGEELAHQYGKLGAHLILAARRGIELERVAASIRRTVAAAAAAGAAGAAGTPQAPQAGHGLSTGANELQIDTVQVDMSSPEDVSRLISFAASAGGGRIDTLILNHAAFDEGLFLDHVDLQAGGNSSSVTALEEGFTRQWRTNILGIAQAVRLALPTLMRSTRPGRTGGVARGGHIGIVSSASTKVAAPFHPGYVTTKTGLEGLAAMLRTEFHLLRVPVTITTLIVGMIATPEITQDEALTGLAMPVPACAREIICSCTRRIDGESYVPRWYALWTLVTRSLGVSFSEWTMNNAYVLKVPRYVAAIDKARERVQAWVGHTGK